MVAKKEKPNFHAIIQTGDFFFSLYCVLMRGGHQNDCLVCVAGRLRRFKAICAFDGTDFHGWQSQPGGDTVQDLIEGR